MNLFLSKCKDSGNFHAANEGFFPHPIFNSMLHSSIENSSACVNTIVVDKSQIDKHGVGNEVARSHTLPYRPIASAQQSKPELLWQRRLKAKKEEARVWHKLGFWESFVIPGFKQWWSYGFTRSVQYGFQGALWLRLHSIFFWGYGHKSLIEHQDKSTDHHGTLYNSTGICSPPSPETGGIQSERDSGFFMCLTFQNFSAHI